ncbi:MAG: hypothetical protein AAF805_00050 [Planctomycetota bacterium]
MSLAIARCADRAAAFAQCSADADFVDADGIPMDWQDACAAIADDLATLARYYRDVCRSTADAQPASVRRVSQSLAGDARRRKPYA